MKDANCHILRKVKNKKLAKLVSISVYGRRELSQITQSNVQVNTFYAQKRSHIQNRVL